MLASETPAYTCGITHPFPYSQVTLAGSGSVTTTLPSPHTAEGNADMAYFTVTVVVALLLAMLGSVMSLETLAVLVTAPLLRLTLATILTVALVALLSLPK